MPTRIQFNYIFSVQFFIRDKRVDYNNDEFYYTNDIGSDHHEQNVIKNFSSIFENADYGQDKNSNFDPIQEIKSKNWQQRNSQNNKAPSYPNYAYANGNGGYAGNAYESQHASDAPRRLYRRSLPPSVSPMKNMIGVLRRMSTTVKTIGR